MKFIHTAFLLLFVATFLRSQTIEVIPAPGNPVLKSFASQKADEDAAFVEQLTGHKPAEKPIGYRADDCPPDIDGYFVTAGDSIEITLDTFGLMQGTDPATLTIENAGSLMFGSAILYDTFLLLTYKATAGFTGAGIENIQVKLSQPDHDTIVPIEIFVRRKNREVVTATQAVLPESITMFCLDSELDFARPKACTRDYDCPDNYDGAGFAVSSLTTYDYADTCLVYYASRFPGVDTVCMRICDEWGVCDVFKIPYRIIGDTLSISSKPFFDDFSSYGGPYPTADLWLDKNVFLNYTLAYQPPSVGLVTFDGIDRRGDDYNIVNGVGDRLTSKSIDLSTYNANSNIFLRFFLEPKGYGLPPDITDKVTLEFRNANRQWVTVGTYDGTGNIPIDSFPPFQFYAIKVDDPQFFHEAFQFRFSAITSPGGSKDLWHLDYVQLSKNEGSDNNFSDVAFTQLPTSILKNYTAMPWDQFKGHVSDETQDQLKSHFYNHFDNTRALGASSISFKELVTGTNIGSFFTVVESGTDNNMEPKVHSERNRTVPAGNFTQIKNELDGIPVGNMRVLETTFAFTESSQGAIFTPNDTVRLRNNFSNYFAHDDGTAEWVVLVQSAVGGEQFASKFHANVEDELEAVQIMFPHVGGNIEEQDFTLRIWIGSLDNDPVLEIPLLKPYYASDYKDTLQGFTTYVLEDFIENPTPVLIPADSDFYVGFQQTASASQGIGIGYDLQNDCDCNYKNLSGNGWSKLTLAQPGALMLRPVFGKAYNTNSDADEVVSKDTGVGIYPNPSQGIVKFTLSEGTYQDFVVSIFNNLGQLVGNTDLEQELDLSYLPSGMYHVQLMNRKTAEVISKRLVLAKD